jgi:hypothetical protein
MFYLLYLKMSLNNQSNGTMKDLSILVIVLILNIHSITELLNIKNKY